MSVFKKISELRLELSKMKLKKTGENKFSGFKYYNLPDIMPAILTLEAKYGLVSFCEFRETSATLTIHDTENTDDKYVASVIPMKLAAVKGANEVQNLGASVTYLTRYLYMNAYGIVENDTFDYSLGENEKKAEELKEIKNQIIGVCKAVENKDGLVALLEENGLEKGNPNKIKTQKQAETILEIVKNFKEGENKKASEKEAK